MLRNAIRAPTNEVGSRIITLDELLRLRADGDSLTAGDAMQSSPVAAAHRILTNSVGALPIGLYQKTDGKREPVTDHPTLYPLIVRANPDMSPMMLKKRLMSACFWHGEAFAYVDRGLSMQLIPLPRPGMTYRDKQGTRWYAFRVDNLERKFSEEELLHLYFDSVDGVRGIGLLEMARQTMRTDIAAQKFAGKFYKQGARPSGVVSVPTKLEPDAKNAVRDSFERMVGGMDGAFRTAVLDLGMSYVPMGISQKDAQFIESRNFAVEEIARFTGIPLHKLQAGKQAYSSNEAQGIDYVVSTLQPLAVQLEQEFSYKLLTAEELQKGLYYRVNLAAEMRGDNESRARYLTQMVQNGVMTPNEARALEERPGVGEVGDELLMTKNLTTLKRMVEGEDDAQDV